MELAEIARALARYRWSILALVVMAMGVAALTHVGESKTYTASARLVLDTPDPESRAESAAIADTAKALATSPSQVRDALVRAKVKGDPEKLARDNISVRALGSSAIVQIAVSDEKPRVAALIANALAREVIASRLDVTKGSMQQVLTVLDRRIDRLNRRISGVDANIAALAVAAANSGSSAARSRLNEAERTRDVLAQQRNVIEAQRVTLLSNEGLRPKPSVISAATPPKEANSSRLLPDMLLAGILALILGIGLAAIIETVLRSVIGGTALARAFDTLLLGTTRASADADGAFDGDPSIALRVVLAAEAVGVTDVALFPVGRPADTGVLAERLQRATVEVGVAADEVAVGGPDEARPIRMSSTAGFAAGPTSNRAGNDRATISIRPFGAPSSNGDGRTGLVVVSPESLTKAEITQAVQLVNRTAVPLLGLIAVTAADATAPVDEEDPFRSQLERLRKLERLRRTA